MVCRMDQCNAPFKVVSRDGSCQRNIGEGVWDCSQVVRRRCKALTHWGVCTVKQLACLLAHAALVAHHTHANKICFHYCHVVQVWMPRGGHLMRGITRANITRLCQQEGLPLRECDFYLTQV